MGWTDSERGAPHGENFTELAYTEQDYLAFQILREDIRVTINNILTFPTVVFAIFGIVSNIMNALVYRRMGLSTSANISFFALALADIVSAVIMIFQSFSGYYSTNYKITMAWEVSKHVHPSVYASNAINSWITAVITMERCCCIILPMKVKMIFTRKVVYGLYFGMLLYQIATVSPHYIEMVTGILGSDPEDSNYETDNTEYDKGFNQTNKTAEGSDYMYDANEKFYTAEYDVNVAILSLLLSYSIPTMVCFVLVIFGTSVLVVGLKRSAQWRESMSNAKKSDESSTKEKRIARMVVAVCIIYIICFLPGVLVIFIPMVWPPFQRFDPYYGNIVSVMMKFGSFGYMISGSTNIVVYLVMSAQYKETFLKLISCK